ncbi:ExbD/TolR family protein [Candidatus Symbiobacter mobilis]|nr:biopolymer transporter ExbD [Candidatus Symbiobacter mobilis]
MSDINVTPMVDVMLVLVVILLLTAPLLTNSIPIDLPVAQSQEGAAASQPLTVTVDAEGNAYLDGQPVLLEELAQRCARAIQANPRAELLLRADKRVAHGRIIDIMDTAHRAGVRYTGFLTEAPAAGTGR